MLAFDRTLKMDFQVQILVVYWYCGVFTFVLFGCMVGNEVSENFGEKLAAIVYLQSL